MEIIEKFTISSLLEELLKEKILAAHHIVADCEYS